jgi:tetratricopeptide (TPR) repeat protein
MTAALTCFALGTHFQKEGDNASALDAFNRAIELDPLATEFLNHRGLFRYEIGDHDGAQKDFEQAIALRPTFVEALNNLGIIHQTNNHRHLALDTFNRAIDVDPSYFSAYCNRGNIYLDEGNLTKALNDFDKAIALQPQEPHPYLSKSLTCLLGGNYQDGWALQEWRWKINDAPSNRLTTNTPRWLGQDSLEGKTILIQSEQGLGDSLQFCRYLPLVEALGAKVIFEVDQSLIALMQSLSKSIVLLDKNHKDTLEDQRIDFFCPLLSLPLAMGTTLANIPNPSTPYLHAASEKIAEWSTRLTLKEPSISKNKPLRVGIAWAGAPRPRQLFFRGFNERRDIPLVDWDALQMDGVVFYSLQVGSEAQAEREKIAHLFKQSPLIDLTDSLTDFAETAALMMNLDIVLSVDTSVIHLAGALGRPALLLNRKATCWRWGLKEEKSRWYENVTILRQTNTNDWSDVFKRARSILSQCLSTHTTLIKKSLS